MDKITEFAKDYWSILKVSLFMLGAFALYFMGLEAVLKYLAFVAAMVCVQRAIWAAFDIYKHYKDKK